MVGRSGYCWAFHWDKQKGIQKEIHWDCQKAQLSVPPRVYYAGKH